MASERVGTYRVKTHLSEYLNRVRYGGERIVIERHGKPVAALVSTQDLERIEAPSEDDEERFHRALAEAGIRVTRPTGKPSKRERRLIEVRGKPLSQQIVDDRR